MSFNHFSYKSV